MIKVLITIKEEGRGVDIAIACEDDESSTEKEKRMQMYINEKVVVLITEFLTENKSAYL